MENSKKPENLTEKESTSKRYNFLFPDWLMDKMRSRASSMSMTVSGYIRYAVLKDLESHEQGKQ